MTDEMNGERERFEAWVRDTFYSGMVAINGDRRGSSYSDSVHHMAWHAWQARASLAANAGSEPWGACVGDRVWVGKLPEHVPKLAEKEGLPIRWLYTHPSPPEGMAGWKPIETAPKYTEHGVRQHLLLGYAPDEIHEDGFVSQGYWMEAEEDAPDNMGHDGGWVDVHFDFFSCGRSFGDEAYRTAGTQPTHWMPLPAPPLASEAKGAT